MRKYSYSSILLMLLLLISSCSSDSSRILEYTFTPIYDDEENIYFEVYYKTKEEIGLFETLVYSKETNSMALYETKYSKNIGKIESYITREYVAYGYGQELNNPIFFSTEYDGFIDIRTGEIIEIDDKCYNTRKKTSDCNILDNDIQISLSKDESSTYKIEISDYIQNELLTDYEFIVLDELEDSTAKIRTFTRYDETKLGIRIDFYSNDQFNTPRDFYNSVILEYDIPTNNVEKLFEGHEFEDFDFEGTEDSYIFGDGEIAYEYDKIEHQLVPHELSKTYPHLNSGYVFGILDEKTKIFKYTQGYTITNISDYDVYGFASYIFKNDLYYEFDMAGNAVIVHRIRNLNTGETLFMTGDNTDWLETLIYN